MGRCPSLICHRVVHEVAEPEQECETEFETFETELEAKSLTETLLATKASLFCCRE